MRLPKAEVTCAPGVLRAGANVLTFHIERPTRPVDLGLDGDDRRLGLGLETMTLISK